MKKVIFVRHGQTLWNDAGKYQGHTDIPLSPTGIQQASRAAKRLREFQIDAIYSSDLLRAKQTAEIIALEHTLPVIAMPQFREINFGIWEGKTFNEIQKLYPELLETWLNEPEKLVIPNGESFQQLLDRAWNGLSQLLNSENNSIIVVAHGGTIGTLICNILGMNLNCLWKIKQGNTGISIVEFYNNKGILTLFNDTYHLQIS
ncbi:MAG: alpha-ribazole phosphatase [Bacillota bacterium]